jgi:UPF0755 protein
VKHGHLVRFLILIALVCGAGFIGWSSWAWLALHRPYAAWEGEAAEIVLEPGLDAGTVLRRLSEAGVIRRPGLSRLWLSWRGAAERLHAGEYRFDTPASSVEVLRRLERGDVVLHSVTLPEGLTYIEIAGRLADGGFGPEETLIEVFGDPTLVRDLDPEAADLEGYLFPDTYHFPRGARPDQIAETLVERFREIMGPEFVTEADRKALKVREAVILASMIERETSVPDERERISQVFHNRLARGMRLECDPTVMYALERGGRPVETLSYADLKFESPWNTYVVRGLPRGPIGNPGRESLLASLRPSEGNDLYFVASPEGGHRFSRDLAGHLRAVAAWRRHVSSSR